MIIEWNKYVAIIDADSIIYTFSYVFKDETNFDIIKERINIYIHKILDACNTDKYVMCVEGEGNFRKNLLTLEDKVYKGKRKEREYPKWFHSIKNLLIEDWKSITAKEIETDDIVTILSTNVNKDSEYINTILCCVDKDLKQVPVLQYNYKKNSFSIIDRREALFNLWLQLLTGDSVDNITGIPGIGEKTAKKLLLNKDVYNDIPGIVFQEYWNYWVNTNNTTFNVPIIEFYSNFMKLYMLQYYANINNNLPKINDRKKNETV